MTSVALLAEEALLAPGLVVIHGGVMNKATTLALVATSSSSSTKAEAATALDVSRATATAAFAAKEALLVPRLVMIHGGVMAPASAFTFIAAFVRSTSKSSHSSKSNVHASKTNSKATIVMVVVIVVAMVAVVAVAMVLMAVMAVATSHDGRTQSTNCCTKACSCEASSQL